jgi:hypothetical protein
MTKTELQNALAEATQTDKRTAGVFLDTLGALAWPAQIKDSGPQMVTVPNVEGLTQAAATTTITAAKLTGGPSPSRPVTRWLPAK